MLKPKIMLNNNDIYTTSRIVTLEVWAEEADTVYSEMKVWGTAEAPEQKDAIWIEYKSTQDIELPAADGIKYVHVKVRDEAGNESDAAADAITLDTTVPPVTVRDMTGADVHVVIFTDNPRLAYITGPEKLVQDFVECFGFEEMDCEKE